MKSYVIKTRTPMISGREIYEGANTDEAYEAFVKAHAATNASDLDNKWFHIEEALRAAKETAEVKEAKYNLSSAEATDLRDLVSKTVTTLEDIDDNTAAISLRKAAGELITSYGTPDMFGALAD